MSGQKIESWVYDHPDVWTSPYRCGGVPCIRGTRIHAMTIIDLLDDLSMEEIMEWYPSLRAGQVRRLREAKP